MKTRFETYSDIELLEIFNKEVGNKGGKTLQGKMKESIFKKIKGSGSSFLKHKA